MKFVNLDRQYARLKSDIRDRIDVVLDHGQYIMGPEVQELEQRLSEYTAGTHCVAVSSGTDALLIALMALDIGPGDEVITSPFSFIATAEAICLLGATPVYVDIDESTYNIDANCIEAAISHRTKAIVPVSLYGQCADMDAINGIAEEYSLIVIEDAAQSFGARYKDRPSGSLSPVATTSFYPSKPLGGYGDGGACFTTQSDLADKIRKIRVHGQNKQYIHSTLGVNGRLDSLQAAVLLAKCNIFSEDLKKRQLAASYYTECLTSARFEGVPHLESYSESAFAQYTVRVKNRDQIKATLHNSGIPTMVFYPVPLHRQQAVANPESVCPISEKVAGQVLSLPICPYITRQEQDFVIDCFLKANET